jgi:vacuolar-type H+-ATPase subunit E/Vma4
MALDDIIKKIKKEAEEKAGEILKSAAAEKEKILKEARVKASEEKKNILYQGKKETKEVKDRIITLARLDSRKSFLSEKRKILDKVFDEALKEFLGLAEKEKKILYKKILIRMCFSGKNELIISQNKKSGFYEEIIKDVNNGLKKDSKQLIFSKEKRDLDDGFILKSGRKEINCTLQTIFDGQHEMCELEVAKILFD